MKKFFVVTGVVVAVVAIANWAWNKLTTNPEFAHELHKEYIAANKELLQEVNDGVEDDVIREHFKARLALALEYLDKYEANLDVNYLYKVMKIHKDVMARKVVTEPV